MTSYSDEEVKEAIRGNEYPPAWNDRQMEILQWCARQYLTLKQEKQVLWPAMKTIEIK